jgi:hypothetical protein
MNVLVACEFSGRVRDAFIASGHNAISLDVLPSERPGPHLQCDMWDYMHSADITQYDLLIAHPPCTYLAVSGARWFTTRKKEQESAVAFVRTLLHLPIPHIALENPISIIATAVRKPDQIVQPWWFGVRECKATCWWLKNLPLLKPTSVTPFRFTSVHHAVPGKDRWKVRSRTPFKIAAVLAAQWGCV